MLGYSNWLDRYGKCQKFVTNFHTIRTEKWNKLRILARLSGHLLENTLATVYGWETSRGHWNMNLSVRNACFELETVSLSISPLPLPQAKIVLVIGPFVLETYGTTI